MAVDPQSIISIPWPLTAAGTATLLGAAAKLVHSMSHGKHGTNGNGTAAARDLENERWDRLTMAAEGTRAAVVEVGNKLDGYHEAVERVAQSLAAHDGRVEGLPAALKRMGDQVEALYEARPRRRSKP